jgi:tetratricopeptide (TPR) repeat protein
MKALSILLLAGVALFFPAYAMADALDDAHRAFSEGRYHDSSAGYQSVLAQNGYSAPVLFDLGNSYYCEGDYARAILAYKRAQWLSPSDPDIAANLQFAQKQAGLPASESRWSDKIPQILSASGWAWVGSGAWLLFCTSLLVRVILPRRSSLFNLTGVASAVVLCAAIAAMVISSGELSQAVVVDKNASALISPFPAAQSIFSPTPGETLTVQETYHDYLHVTDQAGHSGWISKTQITPIIPAESNG